MEGPDVRVYYDEVTIVNEDEEPYTLNHVHLNGTCGGENCVIHNPSQHSLQGCPLYWHLDGFFYRDVLGLWLVDPDQESFWESVGDERATVWSRRMEGAGRIIVPRNRARCTACGTIIESPGRHVMVECPCGASFVDGGTAYRRLGGQALPI